MSAAMMTIVNTAEAAPGYPMWLGVLLAAITAWFLLMLVRNRWVYTQRDRHIDLCYRRAKLRSRAARDRLAYLLARGECDRWSDELQAESDRDYAALEPYTVMMLRFWRWDVRAFARDPEAFDRVWGARS